jgi:multidrug resistance efflux pump
MTSHRLSFVVLFVVACRHSDVPPGYQGLVEYDERIIGFEVAGRISDVPVRRGQSVAPGALLATLDHTSAAASRDARQAELEAARADLALLQAGARAEDVAAADDEVRAAAATESLARKEAERSRTLVAASAITKAEDDRAEAALQQATARRASLQARVQLLRHGARPEELARAQAAVEQRAAALAAETEQLSRYELRTTSAGTIPRRHGEARRGRGAGHAGRSARRHRAPVRGRVRAPEPARRAPGRRARKPASMHSPTRSRRPSSTSRRRPSSRRAFCSATPSARTS